MLVTRNPSERNVLALFTRRSKRNSILEKARRLRLAASDLGANAQVPMFVKERLCPELKKLLRQATTK